MHPRDSIDFANTSDYITAEVTCDTGMLHAKGKTNAHKKLLLKADTRKKRPKA